ncbi:MAG: hypothetical protein RQ885_12445 [Desulfurococcales archaeon]|nr:hypothetical protein [Desulfurococcales archaeon]
MTTALKRGSRDWLGRKGFVPKAAAGKTLVNRKKVTSADKKVMNIIMPLRITYLASNIFPRYSYP